jgi:hypothetical protein
MRRALVSLAVTVGLMLGTAVPVSGLGETEITLNCSDGTSLTTTVDAETLDGLVRSVQALLDYPAGLTCTLIQSPLPVVRFGAVAYAWEREPWVNGGGHFERLCPDGLETFWTNVAINAHNKDSGTIGTFNLTIPGNQCVAGGHFTSRPQCLIINPAFPPGARAWITSLVTQTSGAPVTPGITEGSYVRASFEDNGNPGKQTDKDKLNWDPAFADPTCPTFFTTDTWPQPVIDLTHGNITIHPGKL